MDRIKCAVAACTLALSSFVASPAQDSRSAESRAAESRTAESPPAADPRERAKDDVRAALVDGRAIDLGSVVAGLATSNRERRADAASYLAALLDCTTAEAIRLRVEEIKAQNERYAKTGWREHTFGSNPAEQLRSSLVYRLREASIATDAVEALTPALRLLDSHEADEIDVGFHLVRLVHAEAADDIVRAALTRFAGKHEILRDAVVEIGARKLTDQAPRIRDLCVHYVPAVRAAARDAAKQLGLRDIPEYDLARAFAGRLDRELRRLAEATEPVAPTGARWVRIDPLPPKPPPVEDPTTGVRTFRLDDYVPVEDLSVRFGRVIGEAPDLVEILDWRGVVVGLPAKSPRLAAATAGDAVDVLLKARAEWGHGRSSSQPGLDTREVYERKPDAVVEPQWAPTSADLLVGAWAYVAGDTVTAARCLLPLLESNDDEDLMLARVREALAIGIEERMLAEFTKTGDYAESIRLARRLTAPTFDGFYHQGLARELAAQLERRGDDFKERQLPSRAEWASLQQRLSRDEQVAYLAARLRLIECNQYSIPGGCDYAREWQTRRGRRETNLSESRQEEEQAINPFNELSAMKLTPREAVGLLPMLESDDFLRGFDRYRFLPQQPRTLHRVAWAAGLLVEDVLRAQVVRFEVLTSAKAKERARHVDELRKRLMEAK